MSTNYGSGKSSGQSTSGQSTKDVARDQAGGVASSAGDKAGQVAETSKQQAAEVAGEAKAQARNLLGEARTQVTEQVDSQRDKLVDLIRSFGDELEQMVSGGGGTQSGLATDLARQASERVRGVASALDGREPADLLQEVRSFATRRPGTFLLGTLLAGVVAGRATRGAKAAHSDSTDSNDSSGTSRPGRTGGRSSETTYNPYAGTSDMPAAPALGTPDVDPARTGVTGDDVVGERPLSPEVAGGYRSGDATRGDRP